MLPPLSKRWRLGRWQATWHWDRDYRYREPGWRQVRFGIFRPTQLPPEGSVPRHGVDYKGFIFSGSYWLPWEVWQWR